jgi:hypothetical protein
MDQLSYPHLIATAFFIIIGLLVVFLSPKNGLSFMILMTSSIGIIRRLFMSSFGFSLTDPLVLIGFVIMLSYFILGKAVVTLSVMLFMQIFNPLQGPITVGIYGGLIYFAYFGVYQLGRKVGENKVIENAGKLLVVISTLAAVYGLSQTFFGYSDIEKEWIYRQKLELMLGGIRALSFFCSFSEYVQYIAVGTVVCFVKILKGQRSLVPVWFFLLLCIVASSSRGTLLTTLLVHVVLWAIQGKERSSWWPRLAIAIAILPLIIVNGLSIAKETSKNTSLERLVEHQDGLSDPLNEKKSTGLTHVNLTLSGLANAITQPLGRGTGALTTAAGKFKDSNDALTGGSEGDVGDMFITTGLIGGITYIVIISVTFLRLLKHWHRERQEAILLSLGILMVLFGWWTANAHYTLPMVVWFLIGATERRERLWEESVMQEKRDKRKKAIASTVPTLIQQQ